MAKRLRTDGLRAIKLRWLYRHAFTKRQARSTLHPAFGSQVHASLTTSLPRL